MGVGHAHIWHLRMDDEQLKTFKTLLREGRSKESVVTCIMRGESAHGLAEGAAGGNNEGKSRVKHAI